MIDGLGNGQDFEGPLNQRSLPGLFSSSVSTGLNSNCPSRSEHWCDQNLRKNLPARDLRAGKDREGWNSPPFSFSLVCPPSSAQADPTSWRGGRGSSSSSSRVPRFSQNQRKEPSPQLGNCCPRKAGRAPPAADFSLVSNYLAQEAGADMGNIGGEG